MENCVARTARTLRVSNWGVILVTELAVTSENKRNNRNNRCYFQKGRKGAGVKGAAVANCRIFVLLCLPLLCGLFSLFPFLWGEEKVMTIYDAGPLAAGPLRTLDISENKRNNGNSRSSGIKDGAQRTLATALILGT